ncbi:MAG: hypothetical protein SPH82_04420 [Eubacteriales bacterium]|nr:hypothetical protein [Eubacteriales bacterium]
MKETKRMSAAQRRARQRKQRNRRIAMTVALVLVVALASIGGTIAWLTATTTPVTNTFTTSDIDITLTETGATNNAKSFKMVPGSTIAKDPKVTVTAGSEDCWLFVKIEESTNLDDFITYTVDNGWTELTGVTGVTGVYYRKVAASAADQEFNVLTNNQVTVKNTVTKADMKALDAEGAIQPTLTFTAYAVQSASLKDENGDAVTDPAIAWTLAQPTASGTGA